MIEVFGYKVPTDLEELVDTRATAFVIVDMQNDFCEVGGAAQRLGADLRMYSEVIPRITHFAVLCRLRGVPVVHVAMRSLPNGESDSVAWIRLRLRAQKNLSSATALENVWEFAVDGTWGAEFVSQLQPQPGDVVVSKFRSSAFHETRLDAVLSGIGAQSILVAGCTTQGCVESTVRDASFHGYIPVVLSDCVASDDPKLHKGSIGVMSAYRADVCTSVEVAAIWN